MSAISWIFSRVAAEWVNGNPTMQFVLDDGVRCTRCPTMLSSSDGSQWIVVNNIMTVITDACEGGCHSTEAKVALHNTFDLCSTGNWIAVWLVVICYSTVKMLYGSVAGAINEVQQQQQRPHAGARYGGLPQTQQQAEGAERMQQVPTGAQHQPAAVQQQPSAELFPLTVESG
jgi:hypothetical protein